MIKLLTNRGLGKIPLVHKIWQKYFVILHPHYKIVNGYKLTTEVPNRYITSALYYGNWEKPEFDHFSKVIKKGDVVLDIGAYVGYYAMQAARLVGPEGKVYAFEPLEQNFAILKKNAELNRFSNLFVENKAVSNKNGQVKFYIGSESTNSQLADATPFEYTNGTDTSNWKATKVEAIKLDDYFKKQKSLKVDVIKIDAEGAEENILKGASEIIKCNKSIKIYLEVTLTNHRMPYFFKKFIKDNKFKVHDFGRQDGGALDIFLSRN